MVANKAVLEERVRHLEQKNALLEDYIKRLLEARLGIDFLTGAPMRGIFERKLEYLLMSIRGERPERRAESVVELSLAFVDIDHFKSVNDIHGHAVGDKVLKSVAELLMGSARESDLVARWGGEEFVVLMPGASADVAARAAEDVREKLQELRFPFLVTASFGIASSKDTTDEKTLCSFADKALYQAKRLGRNRVVVYHP